MRMRNWTGVILLVASSVLGTRGAWAQSFGDYSSDSQPPPDPMDPQSADNAFYQQLSPYGEWVNLIDVGWAWHPSAANVGDDFRPYASGGQWIYTADGWEFQSQWTWGDVVFHYGHWYNDDTYGWLWVPGTQWAPAWVDWRESDGYAGWMPTPPDGVSVDETDANAWYFVAIADLTAPDVSNHFVAQGDASMVYASTHPEEVVVVRGVRARRGPSRQHIMAVGVRVPVRVGVRPVPLTAVGQRSFRTRSNARPGAARPAVRARAIPWRQSVAPVHVRAFVPTKHQ